MTGNRTATTLLAQSGILNSITAITSPRQRQTEIYVTRLTHGNIGTPKRSTPNSGKETWNYTIAHKTPPGGGGGVEAVQSAFTLERERRRFSPPQHHVTHHRGAYGGKFRTITGLLPSASPGTRLKYDSSLRRGKGHWPLAVGSSQSHFACFVLKELLKTLACGR